MKRFLALSLFLGAASLSLSEAQAQAWWYPRDCTAGPATCNRALSVSPASRGRWISTVRGNVFVPYSFRSRRSRDGRTHVCTIRSGGRLRPVCLFTRR